MTDNLKKLERFEKIEYKDTLSDDQKEVPNFDLGLDYLGIAEDENSFDNLNKYLDEWFKMPENFLSVKKDFEVEVKEEDGFLTFPSVLNPKEKARFRFNAQTNELGSKVALIVVMHWTGRLKSYETVTSFIRKRMIPLTTLIHVPASRELNPKNGSHDYVSVSPNLGKTIFRTRQDIQDIQFIAKYLKKKMGFEEVGLLTYSLGSDRGIIGSVMAPGLFDFAIFHHVCDDFSQAIMQGFATRDVGDVIRGKIDEDFLQRIWSTISPGAYEKYFNNLPKYTRMVPCKYDFVFCPTNVHRLNEKVKKEKPEAEISVVPLSHFTIGQFPLGLKIMWDNVKYMYEHTQMKSHKKAKWFLKRMKKRRKNV